MQVSPPDTVDVRRLAELRLDRPVVLSLYVDLNPSEFATPPARATAVRSLLDEADRRVREHRELAHEDRVALGRSLERARQWLQGEASTNAAHSLAVFACEPEDMFETIRLPRSVRNRVGIGRSPLVAPLAALAGRERWCVTLVNRQTARVFRGGPDALREVMSFRDEVHGQHDQGGWSQARYQRSVDKEAVDHLKRAADVLFRHFRRLPFEHLLVGGPQETITDFESRVHPYLAERLAGRVDVDVENTNAEQVLESARPCFEEVEERREREALARLDEGSRAGAGLDNVLRPLNERRVEALLLDDAFSAPGSECPECGWLGPEGTDRCPADGTPTLRLDDLTEPVVELALRQSAALMPIRRNYEELRRRGGIAVLCRF